MAGDVRFKIKGKVYDTSTVDEISLRDVVLFNKQAAEIGLDVKWVDVERISQETAETVEAARQKGIADDKIEPHPEAMLMFAVTVWAARRVAHEDVTLGEALDVRMKDIEIVEAKKAPKDRQRSAKKKSSTRLASAPATDDADSESSPSGSTTPPTLSGTSASA